MASYIRGSPGREASARALLARSLMKHLFICYFSTLFEWWLLLMKHYYLALRNKVTRGRDGHVLLPHSSPVLSFCFERGRETIHLVASYPPFRDSIVTAICQGK